MHSFSSLLGFSKTDAPPPLLSDLQGSSSSSSAVEVQRIEEHGPILGAQATEELSLQELAAHLQQLTRSPEAVDAEKIVLFSSQLKKTIQQEPCLKLEQYQTRILQLRIMMRAAKMLPAAEVLCAALAQQLAQAEYAAETLYRDSATPVQDSCWPLYERILRLPSLEPDTFGNAIAALNEKLPHAIQDTPLIAQIQELLPLLLPPTHYLWGKHPPFDESLQKMEEIKKKSLRLLHRLKNAAEIYQTAFRAPLKIVFETYRSFLEEFTSASEQEKEALCVPKAQLTGVGLGFFLLDREVARDLLDLHEQHKTCREIKESAQTVCCREGVFYKPSSISGCYINREEEDAHAIFCKKDASKLGWNINPGVEFAVYAFHQLLGNRGAAPASLAKIRHLFLDERRNPQGRTLQAAYAIEGISLQDFLDITTILPCLERCLGRELACTTFQWLLGEGWQKEYLKSHPELASETLSAIGTELAVKCLIGAFEDLFSLKPASKKFLEFSDRASPDEKSELFTRPTASLVGVLALLQRCPDLCSIAHEAGEREVKLIELADLCSSIEKLKQHFPTFSAQQLLEEIPQLTNRFDRANFSAHFVVALFTNPSDHRSNNFMVTFERDERGGVRSLSLVGVDNSQALDPSEVSTKTVLYLLEQMKASFDGTVAQRLLETNPEELVFDWLAALEEQNQNYGRWQKRGALKRRYFSKVGNSTLQIPLTISAELVPSLYAKAQKLIGMLRVDRESTHKELLEAIQPKLAEIYRQAATAGGGVEEVYNELNRLLDKERPLPLLPIPQQTLAEAAELFLNSLKLDSFPLKLQVSLLGKLQRTFPALAHTIKLPGDPTDPFSRRDFFLTAVEGGYHALAARLSKEGRLAKEETPSLIEMSEAEASEKQLQTAYEALQAGDVGPFKELQLATSQAKVVNGLLGAFPGIDFKTMPLDRQKQVLAALLTISYRLLRLSGCAALNKNTLAQLLGNSPQLLSLELHDCLKVDRSLLALLPKADCLSHLCLSDLPQLNQVRLRHPTLRHLQVVRCQALQELIINHTVKSLHLEDCSNLSTLKAKIYEAVPSRHASKELLLQTLQIKGCSKLQPWCGMFPGSPAQQLHLQEVPLNPLREQLPFIIKAVLQQPNGLDMLYPLLTYYQLKFLEAFSLVASYAESLEPLILLVRCYQATFKDLGKVYSLNPGWRDAHANVKETLERRFFSSLVALSSDAASADSVNLRILHVIRELSCLHREVCAILSTCPNLRKVKLAMKDITLQLLADNCPNLSSVDLSFYCEELTDAGLQALAQRCHGLSFIDLRYCGKITDAGLEALARGCPSLSSINLDCCNITDAGLEALGRGCLHLSSVDVGNCHGITDAGLQALAQGCPNLFSLKLHNCSQITGTWLQALAKGCPKISSLDLSWCKQLADEGLQTLAQGCPSLSSINLHECKRITHIGLQALTKGCPNLSSLNLALCGQVTDKELRIVARGCPSLSFVGLEDCKQITNAGLQALAQGCPNLSSLELSGCEKISKAGLRALVRDCPKLSSLNLVHCGQVTDKELLALAKGCSNLSSIDLDGCKQITDKGLKALARSCPNLASIDLSSCTQITDEGIQALAQGCPNLSSVDLRNSRQITDKGLQALARSCPNLASIDLNGCEKITDSGLQALAQGCPRLSSVDLRNSQHVTDAGLLVLLQSCPELSSVQVYECKKITKSGLRAAKTRYPHITF